MEEDNFQEELLTFLKQDIFNVGRVKNPLDRRKKKTCTTQKESDFMEYSIVEKILYRDRTNEHVVPISTTTLNEYNQKTGAKLENVELHYGPNSDELARSYHANALTIGAAIYFRNGAYKPETEEGRKTLAHELTHIQQNTEDNLSGQKTVEDLEKEAESMEQIADSIQPKYRYLNYNGRQIKVSEAQYKKLMEQVKEKIEYEIENNTMHLNDEDYLQFLIRYEEMEERGELIWQK